MVAGAGKGTVLAGGADCFAGLLTGAPFKRSLPSPAPSFGINAGEIMQRIPTIAANTHVPFSRISVVCFTPMNCVLKPVRLPEIPPPLGF